MLLLVEGSVWAGHIAGNEEEIGAMKEGQTKLRSTSHSWYRYETKVLISNDPILKLETGLRLWRVV